MTSRIVRQVTLALLLGACSTPLWTPRPQIATPLRANDSRRALLGKWQVEFAADSLEVEQRDSLRKSITFVLVPAPRAWARGTLVLRDSLSPSYPERMSSLLDIDFQPILGRHMSCLTPGPGNVEIRRKGSRVEIWFTPGWNDCGFSATARFYGDSLSGTWREYAYAGRPAFGKFRMLRIPGER